MTLRVDHVAPEWSGWVDRMPLGTPSGVGSLGVDAVSFVAAGGHIAEYAAYVALNGKLHVWKLWDGVPIPGVEYIEITVTGETLTGRVAVARYGDNPMIFFTTTSGKLFCYEITQWSPTTILTHGPTFPVTGLAATMIDAIGTGGGFPDVRVVFSKTDNRVYHYGRDPTGWVSSDWPGPGPVGQQAPCSLIATTQGQIGGTAGYRKYIFCTRTGTVNNAATTLYYQWASGTGRAFSGGGWSERSTSDAGGGTVATTGFSLTARARGEDGNTTLEAFLLSPGAKVYHTEHRANQLAIGVMEDLGTDGESTSRPGGIVAGGPAVRAWSDVFWIGVADSTSWLYRKTTDGFTIWAQQISQHGAGEGWKTYQAGTSGTEGVTAHWRGRVANVAMYGDTAVPGSFTNWNIKVLFSLDEGQNWQPGAPVLLPRPAAPGFVDTNGTGIWPWMADPVVDFSDDGTAHIIAMARGKDAGGNDIGAIYYWSTTNGVLASCARNETTRERELRLDLADDEAEAAPTQLDPREISQGVAGRPDDEDRDGVLADQDLDDRDELIGAELREAECDGLDQDGDLADRCPLDADQDGVSDDYDCNDLDATIRPNVPDVGCNGVDENCNGVDDCDRDGDALRDVDDPEPDVARDAPRAPEPDRWE